LAAVAVFGSSVCKPGQYEYETSKLIGKLLAQNGLDVITGGYEGVMEATLSGASEFPVSCIGITYKNDKGKPKNPYVTEEIVAESYIHRMMKLIEIPDAYIMLPGGTGTLLEFAAVWALKERMIINDKPAVALGEMWLELMQTISFYSQSAIDNIKLIYNAETAQEAVDYILQMLKSKK
jgi:uncharacterized protein (TIGR00730 family)